MTESSPGVGTDRDLIEHEGPVRVLLRLASTAGFFRSTDDRFYARVHVGGRPEIDLLRSAAFRDWLIDGFSRTRGEVPSDWAMRRALAALEATARFAGRTPFIFIRVGHDHDGNGNGNGEGNGRHSYLDLADRGGQAVKFGPDGWSIVCDPSVHFRRPHGLLPLPTPSREGSIELLRPYVNLGEADFRLLIVWMAAALRPVGPYPILALYGDQGAAKSTLTKVVGRLIDPRAAPLVGQPRNFRDLMRSAGNRWLLGYDNIGVIPDWLSDGLCMLSTGGAFDGHASFSGDEQHVIHAQRPVILNGIDEFATRADLIDRSLFLNLPPIDPSQRRREVEFWEAFQQDCPRILGGLLDAVVGGLHALPSVRLTELPRMADFAAFAESLGRKLGWPAGTVLSDFNDNRRDVTLDHIEDSPLGCCLLEIAADRLDWTRTATDLLAELTAFVGKRVAASPRWPKSPLSVSRELRRIRPLLRLHGISIAFQRTDDRRLITITKTTRPKTEASSHINIDGINTCFDELTVGPGIVPEVDDLASVDVDSWQDITD
jgi:hypothetical protein